MFHDDVYASLEHDDDTDVADLAETRIELPRRVLRWFFIMMTIHRWIL